MAAKSWLDVAPPLSSTRLSEPRPGPGRRHLRAQLRGLDYAAGQALVAPVQRKETDGSEAASAGKVPDALPQNRDEVRESIRSASLGVTVEGAQELAASGKVTLKLQAGTHLSAYVNEWGLSIRSVPGLIAEVDWVPDAVIDELKYDFGTAEFKLAASGVGPDGIYTHFASKAANKYFQAKLPKAMQRPGYNPRRDPAFDDTLKSLGSLFGIDGAVEGGGGDAQDLPAGLTDASASVGFDLKGPLVYPIAGGDAEIRIGGGTRLLLEAKLDGPLSEMQVDSVTLSASGGGIEVQKVKGFAASLQGLAIHSVTLRRGGKVKANYNLVVEDATEGVIALFRLLAAVATRDPSPLGGRPPDVRLEEIRDKVDAKLSEELAPRLEDLIRRYDDAIPGVSLVEAFGL